MSEWFLLIILKTIFHKYFIFHILISHMLVNNVVSADYLKSFLLQSLHVSHTDWS
jgi:hypothetical protein